MNILSKTTIILTVLGCLSGGVIPSVYAAPLQIIYESQSEVKAEKSILSGFLGKDSDKAAPQLGTKVLASYSLEELSKRKQSNLTESTPEDGKSGVFKGVSLSELVNEAAKPLTAEDRSHIDLVILKGKSKSALMPRAFLVKYPTIQLALYRDGKTVSTLGPQVVLPVNSNSKIQKEGILLDPLFVSDLESVTLTSYQFHYADLFLKKRTDPAAMRGEKLFMQNCVSCHANGVKGTTFSEASPHPDVPGASKFKTILEPKQLRSLGSYLEAYRSQSSTQATR